MDYTDIPDSPYMAEEDEESTAPPPEQPVPIPDPAPILYSYTLDVADTALIWSYGAPLDESAIRQYLIDRGYVCTAVQAQVDETSRPTGIVTVWTDPIPPTITVDITGGDETSAEDTETAETYIADTDVVTIPEGYTYSGDITFASEMLRDANDDPLPMIPVINGTADDVVTGEPESIGYTEISTTITVSSLAGGTTPSFGMQFGGADTGDTLNIRNGTITGTMSPDGSAVDPISPEDWAEYDGSRWTGLVATTVVWTDTAEGAITPKPDEKRLDAFWLYLEANGVEVSKVTGPWNFVTPDTAPTDPELIIFARQAIDADLTDAYLYAEIDNAARDAFTIDWNAATSTSTLTRKVQGQAAKPGQDDRSAPVLFIDTETPVGDVRPRDIWQKTDEPPESEWRRFVDNEWVIQPEGIDLTNENASTVGRRSFAVNIATTALGNFAVASGERATAVGVLAESTGGDSAAFGNSAEASGQFSTATGVVAKATGGASTATGNNAKAGGISSTATGNSSEAMADRSVATGVLAKVPATSPRSIAEGYGVEVPASTPDTKYLGANDEVQVRSDGTGRTRKGLLSPDGTIGWVSVTNDDHVEVNGVVPYIKSSRILSGSGFVDLASIAAGATGVGTITVTGAAAGDVALVSASSQIESGLVFKQAWVSDSNTVSFAITNITGSSINPSGRSWYARVIKS